MENKLPQILKNEHLLGTMALLVKAFSIVSLICVDLTDLVIGVMHSLIMSELEKHLLAELGHNQSVPVLDRDSNAVGVLN